MTLRRIELRGVEVHNLKRVDLDIPHRELVAFCGVSGSGKTSLALDTLYAEGQRRYIESFSAYTRQFLDRLERPAAERIDGLPPAIAVTRENESRSNRSTIGTATETADYLRLLFARLGRLSCLKCGREVRRDTPQSAAARLAMLPAGTRFQVAFPSNPPERQTLAEQLATLKEDGFARVIVGNHTLNLTDGETPNTKHQTPNTRHRDTATSNPAILVVVDRLSAGSTSESRLRDSLETAFAKGLGKCVALVPEAVEPNGTVMVVDGEAWSRITFSSFLRCEDCGIDFPDPEPRLFSFNSPLGACPTCEGEGVRREVVVKAPTMEEREPARASRFRIETACPDCGGTRLRPESLAFRIGGRNIAEICNLKIEESLAFFRALKLSDFERAVGKTMLEQVSARLGYLASVGLGYLALDRALKTLSGGEAQRVALTSALGSNLVNMLYVLDEPSVGLHPRDLGQLIGAIRGLRDRGNTVVVVEHEEALLRIADRLVEVGPGAGERGGEITFNGTLEQMQAPGASLTGDFLSGRRGVSTPQRRPTSRGWIKLTGARGHNLQNLTVDFPLGVLCLVTGVSGSGKSTLVQDTLYGALCRRKRKDAPPPQPYDDVFGDGAIDDVILVDQSPIGRSPRSNPVTYIKAFDEIRAVFAEAIEAKTHNYTASYFSFNVDGGRCPDCEGDGYKQIDMQFLADVFIKCPTCQGRRYRKEILAVTYRGKNIAEVLEMTVREAFAFFRGQPKVQARLKRLIDVGLDYVRLGQGANTLSSGEAQRLKLAGYLSSARRNRTLFLLDEPTTGLHFADVVTLLDCFDALLAVGHSLIVVEHNLQLMRAADYLIDLGPGPADRGGRVVAKGTPEEVAQCGESATGAFLAETLKSTA